MCENNSEKVSPDISKQLKKTTCSFSTTYTTTITILDTIHRHVFYLKHDVSETGFWIRLHVEPTEVGPVDTASLCLQVEIESSLRNSVF
jgi:hypothetical protein